MNINVSHFSWVASCDRNIQLYFPGWIKKRKWKYGSIQLLHLSHKLLLNHAHLFSFEWDHNIRPQNPSCTFWEERWNWEISGKSVKEKNSHWKWRKWRISEAESKESKHHIEYDRSSKKIKSFEEGLNLERNTSWHLSLVLYTLFCSHTDLKPTYN